MEVGRAQFYFHKTVLIFFTLTPTVLYGSHVAHNIL